MNPLNYLKTGVYSLALSTVALMPAYAAEYDIDMEGAHASINFRIPHLGYSIMLGRFNDFSGSFTYDAEQPQATSVQVTVKTASVDSNHTLRDSHLRDNRFLDVAKYPEATFVSERFDTTDDGETGVLHGKLTLRGVTKDIEIDVEKIGEGPDPWGGYRVGFAGETTLVLTDYGFPTNLGPASTKVDMELHIEGVRRK